MLERSTALWFAEVVDGELESGATGVRDPFVVSIVLPVVVICSFVLSVASFTSDAVSPSPSSSSSQLSLTAVVFSAAFLARALARFFAFLLGGVVAVAGLPLGFVVADGATQPSMCPFGIAVASIACWRDPRKRETSSWGVNPGLILSCLRTLHMV